MDDNLFLAFVIIDFQRIAFRHFAFEDFLGDGVFQIFLDGSFKRPCTEVAVEAFFRYEILGGISELDAVAQRFDADKERLQFDVDDLENMLLIQRVEYNYIVYAVEEFGGERSLKRIFNYAA